MSLPFQTQWLLILSLPGTTIAFLYVSFCVLTPWLGHRQVRDPQNMARQKSGLNFICIWGPTIFSSQGNCRSLSLFKLSLGVALDRGRVICFHPLWKCLGSMGVFNTARNIYRLSGLKPDKIRYLKGFFKVALWSEVGQNWRLIEPDRTFAFRPSLLS